MSLRKAYVETTIIADALLKPGNPKCTAALAALKRYDTTFLPVYAIKEWKAGVVKHFAYFHEKLVQTKSLSRTIQLIAALPDQYHHYRKNTSWEALAAASPSRLAEQAAKNRSTGRRRPGTGGSLPALDREFTSPKLEETSGIDDRNDTGFGLLYGKPADFERFGRV